MENLAEVGARGNRHGVVPRPRGPPIPTLPRIRYSAGDVPPLTAAHDPVIASEEFRGEQSDCAILTRQHPQDSQYLVRRRLIVTATP
jgi:hypothetical protein